MPEEFCQSVKVEICADAGPATIARATPQLPPIIPRNTPRIIPGLPDEWTATVTQAFCRIHDAGVKTSINRWAADTAIMNAAYAVPNWSLEQASPTGGDAGRARAHDHDVEIASVNHRNPFPLAPS